jgi:hypothetical protein
MRRDSLEETLSRGVPATLPNLGETSAARSPGVNLPQMTVPVEVPERVTEAIGSPGRPARSSPAPDSQDLTHAGGLRGASGGAL